MSDVYAQRELTTEELAMLLKVAPAADLYAGGHAGAAFEVEGPLETLTVVCCGESKIVILVTRGNPNFEKGLGVNFLPCCANGARS